MTDPCDAPTHVDPAARRRYNWLKWLVPLLLVALLIGLLSRNLRNTRIGTPVVNEGPNGAVDPGPVTFSGLGTAGSDITFRLNGEDVGQTVVGDDGRWRFETTLDAAGDYRLTAHAFDPDGVERGTSREWSFQVVEPIVYQPPTLNSPSLSENGDTITLSGQGTPGTRVELFNNGVSIGTGVVGDDGAFRLTAPATDYANRFSVQGFTAAGADIGGTDTAPYYVAGAALPLQSQTPQIGPFMTSDDGAATAAFTVAGRGQPDATVTLLLGEHELGSTAVDAQGAWRLAGTASVPPGDYDLVANMVGPDGAALGQTVLGHFAAPGQAAAPTITSVALAADDGPLLVSGTAAPAALVAVLVNGDVQETVPADGDGRWQADLGLLPAGDYNIQAHLANDATLRSDTLMTAVAPFVTIEADTSSPTTDNAGQALLQGRASPSADLTILVDDVAVATITADAAGLWRYQLPPLPVGERSIQVAFAAGPTRSQPYLITAQPFLTVGQIPVGDSAAPGAGPAGSDAESGGEGGNDGSATSGGDADPDSANGGGDAAPGGFISGTAPPGTAVQIIVDGEVVDIATADANGRWRYPLGGLAEGEHTIQVRATDAPDLISEPDSFVAAPFVHIEGSQLGQQSSESGAVTLNGLARPGATIELLLDDEVIGQATAGEDGRWSITAVMGTGDRSLRARVAGSDLTSAAVVVAIGPEPGALQLLFGGVDDDPDGVGIAPGGSPALAVILDSSWSMTKPLGDSTRFATARAALQEIISETLPANPPLVLRSFGDAEGDYSCRTDLRLAYQMLNRDQFLDALATTEPQHMANTPLAASLKLAIQEDLADAESERIIILVTDGEETCGGRPDAMILSLMADGFTGQIHIVGMGVSNEALKAEFARWAALGNGDFYDVSDPTEVAEAMQMALLMRYTVRDAAGTAVGNGRVGGPAVTLASGTYQVEVQTRPPIMLADVTIASAETVELVIE